MNTRAEVQANSNATQVGGRPLSPQGAAYRQSIKDSYLNILDDGVKRLSDGNGPLEVDPGTLKLIYPGNKNISWQIEPTDTALIISRVDRAGGNNNTTQVVSFSESGAIQLEVPLEFNGGGGLKQMQGMGIPSSGSRGFKSGRLKPDRNNWQDILAIPQNTCGKYRIEAWSITNSGYCATYTGDLYFGPKGSTIYPGKDYLTWFMRIISWCNRMIVQSALLIADAFTWLWKKANKEDLDGFKWRKKESIAYLDAVVEKKMGREFILNPSHNRIKVHIDNPNDLPNRRLQIKADSSSDEETLHYYIERVWEGRNWIPKEDTDLTAEQPTPSVATTITEDQNV